MRNKWLSGGLALLMLLLVAGVALAQVNQYALPGDNVWPEGIAGQASTGDFYVGSSATGAIYKGNINTPTTAEFLPAGSDGRTDVRGMKVDGRGRLYMSGGATGQMFVYNLSDKKLLAKFASGVTPTFINDVAIAPNGDAYFTDSQSPNVYRVTADVTAQNAFERWDLANTPLKYAQGFNLNGIVVTPDGKYVLTVQSNTGQLWRIETANRAVTEVGLPEPMMAGDGMLLDGQTLYVMRNAAKELVTLTTGPDYAKGAVRSKTTNEAWDFPTTFTRLGNRLLVVNGQLNKRTANQAPTLPFTVSSVPVPGSQTGQPAALPTTGDSPQPWTWLLAGLGLVGLGVAARHLRQKRA